jgi:hypothetical protein
MVSVQTSSTDTEVTRPAYAVFTPGGHFTIVFENSDEPRPTYGPNSTDADLVAAWEPLTVQFGTYVEDGSTVTYTRIIAKNPSLMLPGNTRYSRTFDVRGDTLVTHSSTQEIVYVRVE